MAKRELLATIRDRYRASSKNDKTRILDEFVAVTGHHRKHAIRRAARCIVWQRASGPRADSGHQSTLVVASLYPSHDLDWFEAALMVMDLNQYSIAAAQPGLAVERVMNLWLGFLLLKNNLESRNPYENTTMDSIKQSPPPAAQGLSVVIARSAATWQSR